MNFDASGIWGILVIVGPIALAVVIAIAMLRNRKQSSRHEVARTEAATRNLYDEQAEKRATSEQN